MKTAVYLLIGSILVAGALWGGYFYGKKSGVAEATSKLTPQIEKAENEAKEANQFSQRLSASNSQLINDYNELYDAAQNYVQANQYTRRQPISCNSYTYGMNSMSTYCY